jgi:hypothetical protein
MTVTELRKIAKEKGVPKATSLKKQELLDALQALEAEAEKKRMRRQKILRKCP